MTKKTMYHYYLWALLFIASTVNATETKTQFNNNDNNNHISNPSDDNINNNNINDDNNNNNKEWLGLRIFADTSMLMNDPDACDRIGKHVKVGKPDEEENGERLPSCSTFIVNDCWKLCEEKDVLSTAKAAQIAEIMKPVVNWFRSVVKVKRIAANIVIPKAPPGCADHLPLPEYYSKGGIKSTDLILIVTGRPTPSNTVAWAAECAADSMGRPVFGHINIGPGELEDFENQKQYIYKVLLHELTHVIGFNSYKFPYYRDSSGNLYKSVTKNQVINGKKISKVITPRVLRAAQEHFGCAAMDGVPLEDGGDKSTHDSHWEKRIFRNEYMTGSSDHTAVISSISLALLEDTGWYRVDYSHAEHLAWGYKMGCSFVNDRCDSWDDQKGYFCSQPGARSCTVDRSAIGYCNLVRHKDSLPEAVQYFSDPFLGGADPLSDYCPVVAAFSNGLCSDSRNQQENSWFGEHFGENSKCFDSSLVKKEYWKKQDPQPMCYDFKCVEEEKGPKLQVLVGSEWMTCPFGGQLTSVDGFVGSLQCPDENFCSERMINTRDYDHIKEIENSTSFISPILLFLLFTQMVLLL